MLLWLAEAAGVSGDKVGEARSQAATATSLQQASGRIRRLIPWEAPSCASAAAPRKPPSGGKAGRMQRPARGAGRRDHTHSRAYEQFIQASLDTTCPNCAGTLNIDRSEHTHHQGKPTLEEDCRCLHCGVAYTRILPVPQPNRAWEALTGYAHLVFTSARVQAVRAAKAIGLLTR